MCINDIYHFVSIKSFIFFVLCNQKVFSQIFAKVKKTGYIEASEPKRANSLLNIIGVNSLRLGGFHISLSFIKKDYFTSFKI